MLVLSVFYLALYHVKYHLTCFDMEFSTRSIYFFEFYSFPLHNYFIRVGVGAVVKLFPYADRAQ